MIDLVAHCEWAELGHACELCETIEIAARLVDNGDASYDISVQQRVSLPEGWGTVDERGCPRLRCAEHLPKSEAKGG